MGSRMSSWWSSGLERGERCLVVVVCVGGWKGGIAGCTDRDWAGRNGPSNVCQGDSIRALIDWVAGLGSMGLDGGVKTYMPQVSSVIEQDGANVGSIPVGMTV